ncbi:MAG: Response regulator of zinc sigma-54-dependent two-component system [Candidatus Jettenia ecosi]|uniref:Response regulator of zinc sigma-54-dependent two-component system n=1 Tax=Candidatus Jettenia ecosi TaxID=2494326 RepID=A0A533Q828_9BACT|nr:MAG: Response regulator of zinc sigma-54-dependent two-component system [Candidatus Jettenia ecosi]
MKVNSTKILVVDDEIGYRKVLQNALTERGFLVKTAESGEDALDELKKQEFSIVIIDMKLPGGIDGLELLQRVKGMYNSSVLIMTAYGGIETAVEAMRRGAFNYITKPFNLDEIILNIDRLVAQQKIIEENKYLHSELEKVYGLKKIVGSSREIHKVLDMISRVAFSTATVLITGESGTGKELVARAIHFTGNRKDEKFVVINCATLSENLLESELFGHMKGAFTGAIKDKKGLFEEADGGTLFMDEIGDIPKSVQAKILRVLQEGEFITLGDTVTKKVDVRIIAATNQDLLKGVQEREFREDLYYRLNVINIKMPPLRERKEDIPLLVKHFIEKYNKKENKQIKGISPEVEKEFYHYNWPGNVRELENIIERAITLTHEDIISVQVILPLVKKEEKNELTGDALFAWPYKEARRKAIDFFNIKYITNILNKTNGNVTYAAKESGIERQYLQRMLKRYDIKSRNIIMEED